ncbi:ly-6/neurotoxin-like protein 1 [Lytechinus variegatus]|uniref:ly-6/neurotoxin-like protein 1 n=1 Tax=Lytechinus variegatus TaxID=7654 RepID=UPI001BB12AA1|nr:ly-6/neurotoxin-like protein 1 [Lytechinus variegatus]
MKSFLVPVLLISLVAGSSAIKCFVCNGDQCADPFNEDAGLKQTCPAGIEHCLKTEATVNVLRSCAVGACEVRCVNGVCCCKGDSCNGSTAVSVSFVAMGVAMLVALIFSRQ